MFGIVFYEREPLSPADIPDGLLSWVQIFGAFAAVGLAIWLLAGLSQWRPADRARIPGWLSLLFGAAAGVAALAYAAFFLVALAGRAPSAAAAAASGGPTGMRWLLTTSAGLRTLTLTVGGAAALFAAALPFLLNLVRLRPRRVLALAQLTFKEAIRSRVLYAFSGLLILFLFSGWFVAAAVKPSDQVRTYVEIVFRAMAFLLLLVAALLGSFSIPADIRRQTIHTIVTKPVERFEVVLGRYLGFFALMTLVLVVMTGVCLLYVLREVNPEAAAESLKARMPVHGELRYENTGSEKKATNVGREWDYRQYITGSQPGLPAQAARWNFYSLPASLGERKMVPLEFAFDIYRTTKGFENRGVPCKFTFRTWRCRPEDEQAYHKASAGRSVTDPDKANELAARYGYYEVQGKEVSDFVTQSLEVPGALIKNALQDDPERRQQWRARGFTRPALLEIRVFCTDRNQYVGMAERDLYLREDEPGGSELGRFAWNFVKGSVGLWLRIGLILGLAVCLSTYLSGVITLIVSLVVYVAGSFHDYVRAVAEGTDPSGGPMEGLYRLARRELSGAPLKEGTTTTERLFAGADEYTRVVLRLIRYIFPDVDRFDLKDYVAEGFNISAGQLGTSFLLLLAYLVPLFLLGFYLIKWREVASSN
jgi:hypothetical protein